MCKFCMRNVLSPGPWIISTEDPEISFNLLVYLFGFPIRWRVVGGGKGKGKGKVVF